MDQAALLMKHNARESHLYLAIELSRKKWKLGFGDGKGTRARVRTIDARDFQAFRGEIAGAKKHFGLAAGAITVSCYEAGREGFWVHRALTEKEGIENVIVDAASIDIKRRKRAKTDRMDAESLVRKLVRYHAGERDVWSVVRVPSREAEDERQTHRDIGVLQKERQQHRMRIQALLFTQGLDVEVTPKLMRELDEIRCWNGEPLPPQTRERIRREYARLEGVTKDLLGLRKQQKQRLKDEQTPAMAKIRLMQQLCGIAMKSSWVFVMELFSWRKFRNRREVAGALGLTPMPYQSGDSSREQGISRAGNRRVRAMAIEIAWAWLRYQPESALSRWYQQRFATGGGRMRRIGIVAMARRLMVDLWRFVEFGIVPDGARLKAADGSVQG